MDDKENFLSEIKMMIELDEMLRFNQIFFNSVKEQILISNLMS